MSNAVINFLIKNKIFDLKQYDGSFIASDFILVGTGLSKLHINEVGLKLVKYMKKRFRLKKIYICGKNSEWIVMDFGVFIVHLFLDHTRIFYDLDAFYK